MGETQNTDTEVLREILLSHSDMAKTSDETEMTQLLVTAISRIPGVDSATFCPSARLAGTMAQATATGKSCEKCAHGRHGKIDVPAECALALPHPMRLQFAIKTKNGTYGILVLQLSDVNAYQPYEPFVLSTADLAAAHLDYIGNTRNLRAANATLADLAHASDERHRTLFETIPVGVVYQNAAGFIEAMNAAAEQILGVSFSQARGKTWEDSLWHFIQEDGAPLDPHAHPARIALQTGQPVHNMVVGYHDPHRDAARWIQVDAIPEPPASEEERGHVLSVLTDVTELRLTQSMLADENTLRRLVFDGTRDGVVIVGQDGGIIDANQSFSELLGRERDELRAFHIWDWDAEWPKERVLADISRPNPRKNTFTTSFRRKDGSLIPVEISSHPIEWKERRLVCAICRDISLRNRMQSLVRDRSRALEMIARKKPQAEILSLLARIYEGQVEDIRCVIHTTSDDGRQLLLAAAPSLDEHFLEALASLPIDENGCGCGQTAAKKMPVIREDLSQFPPREFAAMAQDHQLFASWHSPILDANGEILGTFSCFCSGRRSPRPLEAAMLQELADAASICIASERAARQLMQTEARQKAILDNIPDPVWLKDIDHRFLLVNKAWSDFTGVPIDRAIGRLDTEVFPEVVARQFHQEEAQIIADGSASRKVELVPGGDGNQLWFATYQGPVFGAENEAQGICGIARNIDQGKRAEEALKSSERLLRSYFENSLVGMAVVDQALQLEHCNAHLAQMMGRTGAVLERLSIKDCIQPSDGWDRLPMRALVDEQAASRTVTCEAQIRCLNQSSLPVLLSIARLDDGSGGAKFLFTVQDISELKRARVELERFFYISPELLCIVGSDGIILRISPSCERILGFSPEEMVGRPYPEFVHPDDREKTAVAAQKLYETGQLHGFSNRYKTKTGGWRTVEWNCVQPQGQDCIYAIARDMTHRVEHEVAISAARDFYMQLLDEAPALIWRAGTDARCNWFNSTWLKFTGRRMEEEVGDGWVQNVHPDDIQACVERYREAFAKRTPFEMEYRLRRHDGEYRWIVDCGMPFTSSRGEFAGYVGYCYETTERKEAESLAKRSEKILRDILDSLDAAVTIVSQEDVCVFANTRAASLLGKPNNALVGRPIQEALPAALVQGYRQHSNHLSRPRDREEYEIAVELPSGRRTLLMSQQRLDDAFGEGRAMLCSAIDVTERKNAEVRLMQAQKMEAIGQLAGGVAHDFNNLLTAIFIPVGMMEMDPKIPDKWRDELRQVTAIAQRAASLTRQLLMFSRRSVMQIKQVDLNDTISNLLKMLGRLLGENIRLEFRPGTRTPVVMGDQGMIEQILLNLVVNARDAIDRSGRLTIATDHARLPSPGGDQPLNEAASEEVPPGEYAILSVTDTGCGIPTDHLPRIFEPFFTTKEAGKGTGLGLATVYGIVQQHKGWIDVRSNVGRGSTFKIYLPAATLVTPATSDDTTPAPPKAGGNETILLVEDDASVRKNLAMFLRPLGYAILETSNGDQAMRIWNAHGRKIDVVYSDMVMPGTITGMDLATRIREQSPEVAIVLSSGYSQEFSGFENFESLRVVFLPKPCTLHEVAGAIRRAIDLGRGIENAEP